MTRISATTTCSPPGLGIRARRRASGFTLLEILLVVTIIGILASVVVLGATDVGGQRAVRAEAERLALAVELARDEARLRNEVWGLLVDGGTYRFQEYDDAEDKWHDVERREFSADATENNIEFVVGAAFENEEAVLAELPWARKEGAGESSPMATGTDGDDETRPPDVVIYPGGEMTPFKITVTGGEGYAAWVARSDGIQRARATAEAEVGEEDDGLREWLHEAGLVQ